MMTDEDVSEYLRPYLLSGETILWIGKPSGIAFMSVEFFSLISHLSSFVLFLYMERSGDFLFFERLFDESFLLVLTFFLPLFVLVSIVNLIYSIFLIWMNSREFYILTSKRGLMVKRGLSLKVKILSIEDLKRMSREECFGNTSLVFNAVSSKRASFLKLFLAGLNKSCKFRNVSNVSHIERLILKIINLNSKPNES